MEKKKALCLFSGGLDSILVVKILESQGIEPLAVQFISPFFGSDYLKDANALVAQADRKWGISLRVVDITDDYFPMLRAPCHGYGKNFNPCIDCKILMVTKAKEMMSALGAQFIATGEVIGQRPMSQRRDTMRIVERDAGVDGLLLRPLSAKLMSEIAAEEAGIVNRAGLFGFSGRGRNAQISLAATLGITNYPSPAGGCLLTDPVLSKRIEYVVKANRTLSADMIELCRIGRHFVWSGNVHLVVARNHGENIRLSGLAGPDDFVLKAEDVPGPTGLLRGGDVTEEILSLSAGVVARYSKGRSQPTVAVAVTNRADSGKRVLEVVPLWDESAMAYQRL